MLTTPEGMATRQYIGKEKWFRDKCGHGAIKYYYKLLNVDLTSMQEIECTDSKSPANFPPDMVLAIKANQMSKIGHCPTYPEQLLLAKAVNRLNRMTAAAKAKYDEDWAEYCNPQDDYLKGEIAIIKAEEAYSKVMAKVFWELFANPANRRKIWR